MNIREVYHKIFDQFSFPPQIFHVLTQISHGNDNSMVYEDFIAADEFFIEVILNEAFQKANVPISSLSQAINLVGRDQVRNFLFGHIIDRSNNAKADSNFKDFSNTIKLVKRAKESESLLRQLGLDKPEFGFLVGLIFDILEQKIITDRTEDAKFLTNLFNDQWAHALRVGALSIGLCRNRRVNISNLRAAYAGGFLHDVGKLLLALTSAKDYQLISQDSQLLQKTNTFSNDFEIDLELKKTGLTHSELGSLLFWLFEPLNDIEAMVEYHHDFSVLVGRNKELNALTVILAIADHIAVFLDSGLPFESSFMDKIIARYSRIFKLNADEILNLVLTLRANTTVV